MKKTLFLIIAIVVFSLTCSCVFMDREEGLNWRFIEPDEEYLRLDLNGVIYTQKCTTKWMPAYANNLIEIADNIFAYPDDIERIYILLWENRKEKVGATLFIREGVIMPEFDSENVDEICFRFAASQISDENTYYFSQRDSGAIDNLFIKMTNAVTVDHNKYNQISGEGKMKIVGDIVFSNDELQGIYVVKDIFAMGDEYWLFINGVEYYVKLTKEELSGLTGINMPEAAEFSQLSIEEIYNFYEVDFK